MFDMVAQASTFHAMKRMPPWIRMPLTTDKEYAAVCRLLAENNLNTVCRSAGCPNRYACWNSGTATFMILGDVCTRNCRFCGVRSGVPAPVDEQEAERLAKAAAAMKLTYVVVTSVTRDDLPDGGAEQFVRVIEALRQQPLHPGIEVLTPDFQGDSQALDRVALAGPDVFNHNVETVPRLQQTIRPQASYKTSLDVLRHMVQQSLVVKSGLMVGLGESDDEVVQTIHDLAETGCRILTIGQYLSPSKESPPVARYVHPDVFERYRTEALQCGFHAVASAPLVRSSFRAEELLRDATE